MLLNAIRRRSSSYTICEEEKQEQLRPPDVISNQPFGSLAFVEETQPKDMDNQDWENVASSKSSLKESINEKSVKYKVDEFCNDTSINAITRAYKSKSALRRYTWIVMFITSVIIVVVQSSALVQKYFTWPSEVKVDILYDAVIEFPSITVCNLNPLRRSQLRDDDDQRKGFKNFATNSDMDEEDELYSLYSKAKLELQQTLENGLNIGEPPPEPTSIPGDLGPPSAPAGPTSGGPGPISAPVGPTSGVPGATSAPAGPTSGVPGATSAPAGP
ncbi:unnamed protein product, partial [Owenia fusiformis]